MSDRIAVMNQGRVEQCDTPEDVYERPATTFVAGFIGVSNLMPGEVVQANGAGSRVRLDAGVEIEAPTDGIANGERCHAVVRPEKLAARLQRRPRRRADGPSVEGMVESSVYLGTATQIVVKLAGDVPMTVLVPNADESERGRLPGGGASVRLSWAPEHIHVVRESEASGARIKPRRRLNRMMDQADRRDRGAARMPGPRGLRGRRQRRTRERRRRRRGRDRAGRRADRRADDLQLAPLHRQARPCPTSRRRPGSRPSTSRTSTTTPSSSASSGPSSPRASRAVAHHRRHRLDGEEDVRPRLPPEPRQVGDPERREEPDPEPGEPVLRPGA